MSSEEPAVKPPTRSIIKVIWAVSIILLSTGFGALIGWETHGIMGAIALGFVGLVGGAFLSLPSVLLQLIP
ncbi:hypothetical protein DXT91_25985 [Agrobacterium tumefaciens]|uniref:hypothetical protein n=1 Tax=Agrobacterium tumefaciens TaxID=358 RepID=UPI0012B731CF|nr:hypothetical protein [Agrobacterium tumefaciens]MQB07526.1 hypothetical protein [Agrobacterium tumefaciens]